MGRRKMKRKGERLEKLEKEKEEIGLGRKR